MTDLETREDPGPRVARFHASGTGVGRVPYPILITRATVLRRELVTEHMLRISVGGPDVADFHSYQFDDHVRIVFAWPDGTRTDPVPNDRQMLDWPHPFPPSRKYTVRRFDRGLGEIDLDVVLHDGGVASEWAREVAVGDEVVLAGPPGAKVFAQTYDHYVMVVDPTGLPALARWLEESPADVSANVLIDVDHAAESAYPLAAREAVRVQWLDRSAGSRLAEAVAALDLTGRGRTFLFAAGEAGDIRPLRAWAKDSGTDALVTGYWKRGLADLDE